MRVLERVGFDRVLERFLTEHPVEREHEANSNDEAAVHIRNAERLLGRWCRVLLSGSEIAGVMLPWHVGEEGERELVPRSGLTVEQAAAVLAADGPAYSCSNPVCWRKVRHQDRAPFTPLFLSVGPVSGEDYEALVVRDRLTHLDGLHRMVAWWLGGRLPDGEEVEAYVAGLSDGSGQR